MKLCVLGEYLIDFTPQGKTELGLPLYAQNPGGAPTNVACAAAKLGVSAGVITKISTDALGCFLYGYLKGLSVVDMRGVLRSDDPTGLAFVSLREDGEREFTFFRNGCADSMLTEQDIDTALLEECEVFHFSSVSLVSEPARSATLYAAALAKSLGKTVSFDINYRPLLWQSETEAKLQVGRALKVADIVKASEEEAALFGFGVVAAPAVFLAKGAKLVLLTFGSEGSAFYTAEHSADVPAFSVKAVDATGAGDNFMGAFLAALIRSEKKPSQLTENELYEMLRYANAAGAVCASRYGAIAGQATPEDISAML